MPLASPFISGHAYLPPVKSPFFDDAGGSEGAYCLHCLTGMANQGYYTVYSRSMSTNCSKNMEELAAFFCSFTEKTQTETLSACMTNQY